VLDFLVGEDCEQGTAFFLEGVGLVTANHLLERLPPGEHAALYRPSEPRKKFKASPSHRRCEYRDLAILDHDVPKEDYATLQVASSPEHTKDEIVALEFPAYGPGDELSKRRGHIIGRPTKHAVKLIEVSAMLSGGLSGGPIANDRYEVIAVAQRGGNQEHKQLGIEISELLRLAED
jgi:RNA-directed DNA polymerase